MTDLDKLRNQLLNIAEECKHIGTPFRVRRDLEAAARALDDVQAARNKMRKKRQ